MTLLKQSTLITWKFDESVSQTHHHGVSLRAKMGQTAGSLKMPYGWTSKNYVIYKSPKIYQFTSVHSKKEYTGST